MTEWDGHLDFVLHKWSSEDHAARQESVTKLVWCVKRDVSARGGHGLPSSFLCGPSFAAAAAEKPQAPALDITLRSLFPNSRQHQQVSQGCALSVLLRLVRAGSPPAAAETKGQNAH